MDESVLFAGEGSTLRAYTTHTGDSCSGGTACGLSPKWEFPTDGLVRCILRGINLGGVASPFLVDSTSFLCTLDVAVQVQSPAVDLLFGLVLFGSDDDYVYCVRIHTGELAWRFQTGDNVS